MRAADHLDFGHGASGDGFPEPRPRDAPVARHPADAFEGARCCANCRFPPRRSHWKNSISWTLPHRSRPGAASRCCTRGTTPPSTLAPGTARRRALDAALEEIAEGLKEPSPNWRFRFSLMLGLERVLASDPPTLANGLTLRPHQVDALAGHARRADLGRGARGRRGRRARPRSTTRTSRTASEAGRRRARRPDEDEDEDEDDEDEDEDEDDEDAEDADATPRTTRRADGEEADEERGRGGRGARDPRPGRRAPLPLQAPDGVRQDRRGGGLRRGLPHRRRAHPHPPPPARRPVHARPQGAGLRPAPDRRDREGQAPPAPARRSRSRPTPGSSSTRPTSTRTPTASSSATRRTRRSASARPRRSGASAARPTSA